MAYMNQEHKHQLAPKIKEILKKNGVKGSLSVRNRSALVLNIKSGKIDFIKDQIDQRDRVYIQVNPYHFKTQFSGNSKAFLTEIFDAMNTDNFDKSDLQSDYFNVGWYSEVNIGNYDKPYILETVD